jgi:hypothetical protein
MMNNIRLLLLALWLGAALFFSATVAPTVFSVLRSFQLANASEVAGSIVTRTLTAINTSGFVIGIVLLLTAFLFNRAAAKRTFYAEVFFLALVSIVTAVSQWVISPRMVALRSSLPLPIDQVARDNPSRIAFDTLHGYSVALLAVGMLASLIAFFLIARRAAKA